MSKKNKDNAPATTQAQPTTAIAPQKTIKNWVYIVTILVIAVVGTLAGVLTWYFSMPNVEQAFKSIAKNKNYAYTAYVSRPLMSNQIIYIQNTHNKRFIDTGVNQFTVDYSISSENVGVYTEINNVWMFEEVFRGEEGTGLNVDNRSLKAFELATESVKDNFDYNKQTKRYELKESSYNKVYANSLGGTCEIYRKDNKIYIDTFFGLDKNNKERIIITKIGGVSIKLPKITLMGLE